MTKEDLSLLDNKEWRMNNLYRIVDKQGNSIPFKLNPVQQVVLRGMHNRNICLKARQLGMSTFSVLSILDDTIFNDNLSSGIVSYSLDHAQHIFKKILGHALDNLTPYAKELAGVTQRSATEISFRNGSSLRVGTTLRGGTCQNLLVSEFGKTCARNPIKAEEVVTGTLQSVPIDGKVIIESTGEGSSSYFYEMCTLATQRGNEKLSPLEYKMFFFPWYTDSNYTMKQDMEMDEVLTKYLDKIAFDADIELTTGQRNWYAFQKAILGDKVAQEFPSTITEGFLSNSDAYYFQVGVQKAYNESRVLKNPLYDGVEQVYVAMDIGVNDMTCIIFFQVIHGEIRIIDYYEDNNKGVDFYCNFLQKDKKYQYRTIFLPHDSVKRDGITVENSFKLDFEKHFYHTDTEIVVLKRTDKNLNINNARIKLDRCVFAVTKVKPLIDKLVKYRKQWSESVGRYLDKPLHDIASDASDAFQYAMQGVTHIEALGDSMSVEKLNELKRRSFYGR
jgi:hypothetical protein